MTESLCKTIRGENGRVQNVIERDGRHRYRKYLQLSGYLEARPTIGFQRVVKHWDYSYNFD